VLPPDSNVLPAGVGTVDQVRPPSSVYLMITHVGQSEVPSPSTQPVSGEIQLESTHHVAALGAEAAEVVDLALLVAGLAELVPATVRVMTTAVTKPSLRTVGIYTTSPGRQGAGLGHQPWSRSRILAASRRSWPSALRREPPNPSRLCGAARRANRPRREATRQP
jgi:hypothetical protein